MGRYRRYVMCALLGALLLASSLHWRSTTNVAEAAAKKNDEYPLSQLKLLRYILMSLQKLYVDPTQFSPPRMYRKGLLRLEQKLTSFQVNFAKSYTEVQLGPHKKRFANKKFLGIFDVWIRLRPIAQFIDKHHKGKMSRGDIEYFLVRGVMATLDHQTMIVNPKHYRGRRRRRAMKSGGIGVTIRMKDKRLMIVKVMPEGPSEQAGLQGGDQIARIDGEQVIGGTLRGWSNKLRGLRGTRITLHIKRKDWKKPRRFVLIRASLRTPNVTGHLLPGKIGYVRLRQFIHGSALAIREQLARIRHQAKGSLFGLILDLRNNGGGLVREAVAICSMFVEKGEVTTFAGANIKPRTHNVRGRNTEERYPMITLVNGYSASASELLSGALQTHNRSLIVGRQSYGKGTVQRAGPMGALGLYFRITIAQYMLPKNQSIQAVGITPDVEVLPVSLRTNKVRYYSVKPRDLALRKKRWPSFLLQNMDPKVADKSWAQLHYLADDDTPPKPRKPKRKPKRTDWYIDPSHPLGGDFDVWFSRYLLSHAKSAKRDIFYSQVKKPLQRVTRQEERKLVKALRQHKLNWQLPRRLPRSKARLNAKATLLGVKGTLTTGVPFRLRLTVKNVGKATAYRTRAVLDAHNKVLKYREFLIGRLKPGQERSQTLTLTLPHKARSRVDVLRFAIEAEGAETPPPLVMYLPWRSPPRPRFAVAAHIQDPAPDGNGDGQLQAGERATLVLSIKNASEANSPHLKAILRDGQLRVKHVSHDLGQLPAGQQRTLTFGLHVPDNAKVGQAGARIFLYDQKLRHVVQHDLKLTIARPLSSLSKADKGFVTFSQQTLLRTSPLPQAPPIATAPQGAVLRVVRQWKSYVKVALPQALFPPNPARIKPKEATKKPKKAKKTTNDKAPKKRRARPGQAAPKVLPKVHKNKRVKVQPLRRKVALTAWVHTRSLRRMAKGTPNAKGLTPYFHFQPPAISLKLGAKQEPYRTSKATIKLPLTVQSAQGIRDIYLLRGKRKLFYQPVQYAQPDGNKRLQRTIDVPLKPGVNALRLTVRTGSSRYHRRLYITRTTKTATGK